MSIRTLESCACFFALCAASIHFGTVMAADNGANTLPTIEVTTSKLAEPIESTPAMVTVIGGDELRARGVRDLRTALSMVAGVDIAPGGDAGPAGSVPGMWGLREFDAFLLVVDGIPSGGAFNPALTTLDLNNVERIEVLRGAAPVMYGATSFVGVIQIIHYAAGATPSLATIGVGTRSSGVASISSNLSDVGAFKQSLSADVSTKNFTQDRSGVDDGHLLYRATGDTDLGKLHFDLDAATVRQQPYSPHPVEDGMLSSRFPLDANANPTDAKQNINRIQFNAGLERSVGFGEWVTTFSIDHSNASNTRGFLRDDFSDDGVTHNADGFRQSVELTDVYFDTFIATHFGETLTLTYGFDWLYGNGKQNSDNFEYAVLPNGSNAPDSHTLPIDEGTRLKDRREFAGVYTQADWKPMDRWDLMAGVRLNRTQNTAPAKKSIFTPTPAHRRTSAATRAAKRGRPASSARVTLCGKIAAIASPFSRTIATRTSPPPSTSVRKRKATYSNPKPPIAGKPD